MIGYMEIPLKISITTCIEQGAIYHYRITKQNQDGTAYDGNRFFIVINANPKTDEILVLVTITKEIDNVKEFIKKIHEDSDTVVPITISDFPHLSRDSAVNCNNVYQISMKELIKKIENGGKIFKHKLPETIISALISGVMKSNQVSPEVKEMLV